jgi:hypothetical protein
MFLSIRVIHSLILSLHPNWCERISHYVFYLHFPIFSGTYWPFVYFLGEMSVQVLCPFLRVLGVQLSCRSSLYVLNISDTNGTCSLPVIESSFCPRVQVLSRMSFNFGEVHPVQLLKNIACTFDVIPKKSLSIPTSQSFSWFFSLRLW